MKFITLSFFVTCFFSFSEPQKNLFPSKNIWGCHGIYLNSGGLVEEVVVYRYQKPISSILGSKNYIGLPVVFKGRVSKGTVKERRTMGNSVHSLNKESVSDVLPENGENWTYEAPEGTILSTKGNYKAFFLYELEGEYRGLLYEYFPEESHELRCFTSESELNKKISLVLRYSPF